jgi:putative ABC transport system permease protein
MSLWGQFRSGLATLLRRKRTAAELDEELSAYLEMAAEEKVKQGMSAKEALRAVRMEQGSAETTREEVGAAGWESLVETSWQDLRFAARTLRKSRGFTAVAVLTLAFGIGANTAIFSYIDAWLIQPLPYLQPERLLVFTSHDRKNGWTVENITSTASFLDYQKQNTSFEQTVAWSAFAFNLTGDGEPALVDGARVSWNFFDTLGVKPILGRTFKAQEDEPGTGHVAILAEGLWQSRYGGDPGIIGRTITIESEPYTVVGVMPGKFQFPLRGLANLWAPLAMTEKQRADRGSSFFSAFGRLKPGVKREQAEAESQAIYSGLEQQFPQTNTNLTLLASTMKDEIARNEGGPQVLICFAIVGLVLLIACSNVANLMLARAIHRAKEFGMRGALGATRLRLVRQVLTESLLLFLMGGAAGALLAALGVRWLGSQIPEHIRGYLVNYGHVDLSITTLGFTLGVVVLCGAGFGLFPAFANTRLDLNQTLKETGGQASGTESGARLRRAFVAAEIALAVVVLISTTLLVRSFIISVRTSPGYNPAKVMVAQVALPKSRFPEEAQQRNFAQAVVERLRALPQVTAAGAASSTPFGGYGAWVEVQEAGKPAPPPGERQGARYTAVSEDYFRTMQIELLKGRAFDSSDKTGSAPAAIVNETMARALWPQQDPIGRQLQFGEQHSLCTVVGVVGDVKMYQLRERPRRHMYVSLAQFPSTSLGFVARTEGTDAAMATGIRDAIWAVDRNQPISSVEELDHIMAVVNTGDRMVTQLMVFFGALAMFLAAIGIYGVMSNLVAQRRHEIGIRAALGASPRQVMRLVLAQGLNLALAGIAVGLFFAFLAGRALASQLYRISPSDPLTFAAAPVLLAAVALLACWIPARRAMAVNPVAALRSE